MNNSNSFIMQDQVGDVVKSVMGDGTGFPFFKLINLSSLIVFSIVISTI